MIPLYVIEAVILRVRLKGGGFGEVAFTVPGLLDKTVPVSISQGISLTVRAMIMGTVGMCVVGTAAGKAFSGGYGRKSGLFRE